MSKKPPHTPCSTPNDYGIWKKLWRILCRGCPKNGQIEAEQPQEYTLLGLLLKGVQFASN